MNWRLFAPALAGLLLIVTGLIKATGPNTFAAHLAALGFVPRNKIRTAVVLAAGGEVFWGLSLLTRLAPGIVVPLSVVLLILLSGISWSGVRTGKTKDCGCYGGYVEPSINQSLLINAVLVLGLILSWTTGRLSSDISLPKLAIATLGGGIIAVVCYLIQNYEISQGRAFLRLSPIQQGKTWKNGWIGVDEIPQRNGETLVTFLSPDCPFCGQWVRVANVMGRSSDLPTVLGVVAVGDARKDRFAEENGIGFPIVTVSPSTMARLTEAVPTTALVRSGVVTDVWIGQVPPAFVQRFARAFFPEAQFSEPLTT